MKTFFGEFKQFIARGNVMDMAVGGIIGGGCKRGTHPPRSFLHSPAPATKGGFLCRLLLLK